MAPCLSLLYAHRRREVLWTVDVADHAWVTDRNLDERAFIVGEEAARALVAFEHYQLFIEASADAHRVSAPRAKVRRGDARAFLQRRAHRRDRRGPHERHVGQRDDVAVLPTGGARGAREAHAHAFA